MSTSTDTVVYEPAVIEVCGSKDLPEVHSSSVIDIHPCNDTDVAVSKKEYTIISDGLFIPESTDTVPPWIGDLVNNAVHPWVGDYITDIVVADRNLLDALDALIIANNAYQEMVHIDVRIDQAIASVLTTLNSRLDASDATIINLSTTRVTADQASAISLNAISSSLNDGSPDSIGGRFVNVNSSITTLAGNVTTTRDLLESRYGELNEAIVDLEVEVGASINEVYSSFVYDSTLRVGDDKFKSGFGLNASVKVPVPGEPGVYRSEFWIDAQRFKFTNSNQTGAVSPFTIDASGSLPEISFNGFVSFSNVTGPDKPEAGATRNESRGAWATSTAYIRGDVVTADGNSWVARNTHTSTSSNRPPVLSTTTSLTWALLASKGDEGLTVTTVQAYRRSATALVDSSKPSTTSTYHFNTGAVTGLNNSWSASIPAGTDPLYVTVASVDAPFTATTVSIPANKWSTPVKYVENGLNTATVFLFRRTTTTTTPPAPSNSNTYSFTSQSLTTTPNNSWSENLPTTGGRYRWITKATAAGTGNTDTINSSEWSVPRLLAEDGLNGVNGTNGTNGSASTVVYRRATSVSTPIAGWSNPPSGWNSTVPTGTLPVWECTGTSDGSGWWVWQHPRVSTTYWTKPNETLIDGNRIFTGDAYVDTLQIKGFAVTVAEHVQSIQIITYPVGSTSDPWTTRLTKQITHPGVFSGGSGVIVMVNFSSAGVGGASHIECRAVSSSWTSPRVLVAVEQNRTSSNSAIFYDPNPSTNPTYSIQFRAVSLFTSSATAVQVDYAAAVFSGGKR